MGDSRSHCLEQALLERLDPDAQFRQAALNSISEQLSALAQQASDSAEEPDDLGETLDSLAQEIGEMSEAEL